LGKNPSKGKAPFFLPFICPYEFTQNIIHYQKQFGTFKKAGALAKNIGVRNGGESMKVFLMPAGTGCVSIKKEIVR